jgi:hypothetical protein
MGTARVKDIEVIGLNQLISLTLSTKWHIDVIFKTHGSENLISEK